MLILRSSWTDSNVYRDGLELSFSCWLKNEKNCCVVVYSGWLWWHIGNKVCSNIEESQMFQE